MPLNSRVVHTSWGKGTVMRDEGDKIIIMFDLGGYKTLAIDSVIQRGSLKQLNEA